MSYSGAIDALLRMALFPLILATTDEFISDWQV
jgi:hypothetical protein